MTSVIKSLCDHLSENEEILRQLLIAKFFNTCFFFHHSFHFVHILLFNHYLGEDRAEMFAQILIIDL